MDARKENKVYNYNAFTQELKCWVSVPHTTQFRVMPCILRAANLPSIVKKLGLIPAAFQTFNESVI